METGTIVNGAITVLTAGTTGGLVSYSLHKLQVVERALVSYGPRITHFIAEWKYNFSNPNAALKIYTKAKKNQPKLSKLLLNSKKINRKVKQFEKKHKIVSKKIDVLHKRVESMPDVILPREFKPKYANWPTEEDTQLDAIQHHAKHLDTFTTTQLLKHVESHYPQIDRKQTLHHIQEWINTDQTIIQHNKTAGVVHYKKIS